MRIAVLLPELAAQGGGDRQALYLARELQAMGHEVVVYATAYDRGCYPEVCSRLRIVETGSHPLARLPFLSGRLRVWLNMRRLAAGVEDGFDVLNPHHWPPHWAAVRAARRMSSRPAVVWMCNDPPWPRLHSWSGVRRPFSPLRALSRRLFQAHDRRLVRAITRTVVLSRYAKGLVDATFDIDSLVVRSGVDAEALSLAPGDDPAAVRERYGVPRGRFLALALGILMPHRRLEDAIAAVADLADAGRDIHLLIAGSGLQYPQYTARLHNLARRLGVRERVTFAGGVPENRLKLFYHACDAFIFPNENQTWALAVMEAMACGKPTVVSTGAAVREALEDEKTAFLVPPRSPDAIARVLRGIMDDPERARAVAERGRRLVTESFSWRRYAESMLRVFEDAVQTAKHGLPAPSGRRVASDAPPAAEETAAGGR